MFKKKDTIFSFFVLSYPKYSVNFAVNLSVNFNCQVSKSGFHVSFKIILVCSIFPAWPVVGVAPMHSNATTLPMTNPYGLAATYPSTTMMDDFLGGNIALGSKHNRPGHNEWEQSQAQEIGTTGIGSWHFRHYWQQALRHRHRKQALQAVVTYAFSELLTGLLYYVLEASAKNLLDSLHS